MKRKNDDVQRNLLADTGTTFGFWKPRHAEDYFMLVLSDESGYISISVNKERWKDIKSDVDRLIAEHLGGKDGK